ncbi:MAG TPA: hypothetical protein VIK33_12295 [Anaerolineae bacterium]
MDVRERIAAGQDQVMAVQHAVQAVLERRARTDHPPAMRDQRSQFAHVHRRHPHFGDQPGRQQARQHHHIDLVGLDARLGDQRDLGRVGDEDALDEGTRHIVEVPRIGRRFDPHDIGWLEMRLGPLGPVAQLDATRRQHDLLLGVDAADHQVVLMQVDAQIAFDQR